MDDETRKMMTEWLGGYNWEDYDYETADDMMHCKNRLVELGLWEIFWWESNRIYEQESPGGGTLSGHTNWLLAPKLFCDLVAKFLEEKKKRLNDGY